MAKVGETNSRGPVKCVVRPERVKLEPYDTSGENRVPGIVEQLVYLGSATRVVVHLATGQTLQSLIQSDGEPSPVRAGNGRAGVPAAGRGEGAAAGRAGSCASGIRARASNRKRRTVSVRVASGPTFEGSAE